MVLTLLSFYSLKKVTTAVSVTKFGLYFVSTVAFSNCLSSTQAKCEMSRSATQAFQPSEDMTENNAGMLKKM